LVEKKVDKDRFFWNPETKEKVLSHYVDGSEIKLSDDDKKKAERANLACIKRSLKQVSEDVSSRKKDLIKRGRPSKKEELPVKKELQL